MTRDETLTILGVLRTAYPNFYRGMTKVDLEGAVELWHKMFADDLAPAVAAAVKSVICTRASDFPPSIGAVKAMMGKLAEPKAMTEMEAWSLVAAAVRRSSYMAQEEFHKLPEGIQRIVGSPSRLREWAAMDANTLNSVVSSNFQRSYRAAREQSDLFKAIPADVKKQLSGLSERMKLGERNGEQT